MTERSADNGRSGVGLEIGAGVVRGVRLDLRHPDGLIAAEFPVDGSDDRSVQDAIVRVSGVVAPADAPKLPTRLALAPPQLLMQAIDVTGCSRHELLRIADDALHRNAADSMTIFEDGLRRRLVLVRWQRGSPDHVSTLAQRAGLHDVSIEPAPLAIGRVLADGRHIVRRVVEPGTSWLALVDDGLPTLAVSVTTDLDGPLLTRSDAPRRDRDPDELVGGDRLLRWLLEAAAQPDDAPTPVRGISRPTADAGSAADGDDGSGRPRVEAAALHIVDRPLAAYPRHDLRASERVAVALGAAIGASGATDRQRRLEPLAPLRPTPDGAVAIRRPWAVQRVEREPASDARTRLLTRRARRSRRGATTSRRYRRRG